MTAPTKIKLTKAERMGLEEVFDHGSCARTWPVILKLQNRKFIKRTMGHGALGVAFKLRPLGKRALAAAIRADERAFSRVGKAGHVLGATRNKEDGS